MHFMKIEQGNFTGPFWFLRKGVLLNGSWYVLTLHWATRTGRVSKPHRDLCLFPALNAKRKRLTSTGTVMLHQQQVQKIDQTGTSPISPDSSICSSCRAAVSSSPIRKPRFFRCFQGHFRRFGILTTCLPVRSVAPQPIRIKGVIYRAVGPSKGLALNWNKVCGPDTVKPCRLARRAPDYADIAQTPTLVWRTVFGRCLFQFTEWY